MKSSTRPPSAVLLVEDDEDIRAVLSDMLRFQGYSVEEAENGADALAKLRASKRLPSVILLDVMMPVMDGWEFRDEQVQDPRLARVPVVVLTADGNAARKAAEMKAAGALTKPVDIDDLLAVVSPYCRPSRRRGHGSAA